MADDGDGFSRVLSEDEIAAFYRILELQPGATPEQIEVAWQRMAHKWNPDLKSGPWQTVARKNLFQVNAARVALKRAYKPPASSPPKVQPQPLRIEPVYEGEPIEEEQTDTRPHSVAASAPAPTVVPPKPVPLPTPKPPPPPPIPEIPPPISAPPTDYPFTAPTTPNPRFMFFFVEGFINRAKDVIFSHFYATLNTQLTTPGWRPTKPFLEYTDWCINAHCEILDPHALFFTAQTALEARLIVREYLPNKSRMAIVLLTGVPLRDLTFLQNTLRPTAVAIMHDIQNRLGSVEIHRELMTAAVR